MVIKDKLEPEEIPFMHYGIINKFNYKNIENIPIKRWDPLSQIHTYSRESGKSIILKQNNYGHYSYISPIRASRPFENNKNKKLEFEKNSVTMGDAPVDIFEPMLKGKHFYVDERNVKLAHAIVIADGEKIGEDPFTTNIKINPDLQGNAISMINKFPAMVRVVDPEIYPLIIHSLEKKDLNSTLATGVCFITLPKKFYDTLESIPASELRDVFLSMNVAIKNISSEAFKQRVISKIPISSFFNVGRTVGGSQRRIHLQVYMDLNQDGHGARMDGLLKAFNNMRNKGECRMCNSSHGDGQRIVIDGKDWIVFASGSPIRNYHLRFTPKTHIENLYDISASEFLSLSSILKVLFLALNDLGVNQNRNIVFNTKPHGYDSYFHIFGDILPFEFVGGAEMADDMRVVRISPKAFAKNLRDTIKKNGYD